jgi:hypothetical protein
VEQSVAGPGDVAVVAVTCVVDAVDHAVRLDDLASGVAEGCGRYLAVCGQRFPCAPMATPPGQVCPACRALIASDGQSVRARTAPGERGAGRRRARRQGGRHRGRHGRGGLLPAFSASSGSVD